MHQPVANGRKRVSVLVTDGEERAALACVRSLSAAGYDVVVASPRKRSLAGASRFARARVVLPSALVDPAAFLSQLSETVRAREIDVLLPVTEHSLRPVLAASDRFPGVHVPFAGIEQFRQVSNKAIVLRTASELGIATPAQHTLETAADARDADKLPLAYPLVLKPSRSVVSSGDSATKVGVSYAANAGELARKLDMYPPEAFPILLQQRIVGPGIGVFLLFWNGEVVATSGHRRIRECPPSGGVSAYREAIVPPAALVKQSRELLDHFGWQGVAMVEYKVDEATGTPYLMEINGRFWGSLQLAVDAGVDFPRLLVESALGKRHEVPILGGSGVRSRWEWGEVNHLIARLRASASALGLPPAAGGRGRALLDFLAWRRGDRLEVLRLGDPGPFVRETIDWLQRR